MLNFLVLIPDALGVSLMGGVALWGLKYFAYLVREPEIRNLRYIWVPNIISFSFFFALVLGMFANDAFGTFRTPFYIILHITILVGSGFFGLGMYRFIKTIKSQLDSKRKAQASLWEIQNEITKRISKIGPQSKEKNQNSEQPGVDPSQKAPLS